MGVLNWSEGRQSSDLALSLLLATDLSQPLDDDGTINTGIYIIRPHRSITYVDAAYYYRPSSVVCRSVCWSVCMSR